MFTDLKQLKKGSIFVTHGGGANPILNKKEHQAMHDSLGFLAAIYNSFSIKGIIVFSAHWQTQNWTILDVNQPQLYYDYGNGYPKQCYEFKFAPKSTSEMRDHIKQELAKGGMKLESEKHRGIDHGVFIPLMIMYPKADVPLVQISIRSNLDPEEYYRMGKALRNLKNEGYLILTSGSSCHGQFRREKALLQSQQFEKHLSVAILQSNSEQDLQSILQGWKNYPFARLMHPRQQHLIPLFINLGVTDGKNITRHGMQMMGLNMSNYLFS